MKNEFNNAAILMCGPSGAGKTTIMNALLSMDRNFQQCIGVTTREMRDGEENGVDYHFLSMDELNCLEENNKLLEVDFFNGQYYGYTNNDINSLIDANKIPILCATLAGVERMSLLEELKTYSVFVKPPSMLALELRLTSRNEHKEEQIKERLETAVEEMKHSEDFDLSVVGEHKIIAAKKIRESFLQFNCV
jgi:guanylate kinase